MAAAEHPEFSSTIAGELDSPGNARLLRDLLATDYVYRDGIEHRDDGPPPFDLAVVDAAALDRRREALRAARSRAAPSLLPVLLILDGRRSAAARIERELDDVVDDVVRVPTSGPELHARVRNLLRMRAQSTDLAQRHEEVQRVLAGTTRALNTLHAGNEVLVRAADENTLLADICRVIVEEEGYELAWAGFVRNDGARTCVEIQAAAGPAADYVSGLTIDTERFHDAPVWRTVRTQQYETVPDVEDEPSLGPVLDMLRRHGLRAVITLPLTPETGARGALVLYSRWRGDFSGQECSLLQRLARNIEFGLNALRADREREQQKAAIRDMAYSDALTRIPNRHSLEERLDSLLGDEAATDHVAVLFIDLDHFKLINDALGHAAGDEVLIRTAERLQRLVREEDLVARQGGDEFIVVMASGPRKRDATAAGPDLADAALRLAHRLTARLSEPLIIEGYERSLEASVGISLYPEHARDAQSLIECADTAMYAAKGRESRVTIYEPEIARSRRRQLSLEARLSRAIERNELSLRYQPIFDLHTGTIPKAEALLRWPQPEGGEISPGEFIPVAESAGFMPALGSWVIQTAVHQLRRWREAGVDLRLAINLSVDELRDPGTAEDLAARITAQVPPGVVDLEITESALIDQPGLITDRLQTLHGHGFGLAIDDFGTGYSSLWRLQELPIDRIKLDKAFVHALRRGSRGEAILETVQRLADNLGMETIAEGVETEDQRAHLRELGYRLGQGFLVSPAIEPDALVEMLGATPIA